MLEHGGGLIAAAQKYNRAAEEWLDLSTGINPIPYTVPEIPIEVWRRLPQNNDDLLDAAAAYYGVKNLIATNGSQAAIQTLPSLFKQCRVGMHSPSYNEHKHAWLEHGHEIIEIERSEIATQCLQLGLDVLLLCNPNNPTGELTTAEAIEKCLHSMKKTKGVVIIDEAFMDSTPEASVLKLIEYYPDNLIVLRSLGKFFGLAGARVGFVAGSTTMLQALEEKLGPWTISGPSRFIAIDALRNFEWQATNRVYLKEAAKKLCSALTAANFAVAGATDYFVWIKHSDAPELHDALCKDGILTRLFSEPPSLRFGLPASTDELTRLQQTLNQLNNTQKKPINRSYSPYP